MTDPARTPADAGRRTLRVLLGLVALLLLAYAVQVLAPMRMMNDSVSYFLRAHQLLLGEGLASNHERVEHPVGYSVLLAGMIHIGMDNLRWFIALNVLCLCVSLALLASIYRRAFSLSALTSVGCVLFFLLSWTLIKHVPMLYSELLYLAISFAILWLLVGARPKRLWIRVGLFLLAAGLTYALIQVRTIGIAMLPALAWYIIQQFGGFAALARCVTRSGVSRGVTLVLVLAALALAGYKLATYDPDSGSRYVRVMAANYAQQPLQTGLQAIDYRVQEFGKLAINAPERALRRVLPGAVWRVPVYTAGTAVLALLAVGLWSHRRRLTPVHLYLLGYLALQLPWLSFDARFWLPVMPLMLPILLDPLRSIQLRWPKPFRAARVVYGIGYATAGALALGLGMYYTALGRGYAEHDLWFRPELMVAYGLAEEDEFTRLDIDAINLVRRYDLHTPGRLRLTDVPRPSPIPYEPDPALVEREQ